MSEDESYKELAKLVSDRTYRDDWTKQMQPYIITNSESGKIYHLYEDGTWLQVYRMFDIAESEKKIKKLEYYIENNPKNDDLFVDKDKGID